MKKLLQTKSESNTYMQGWYCFYRYKNSIPNCMISGVNSYADDLDYFNFGSPVKDYVLLADAGTIIISAKIIKLFLQ